MQSQKDNYHTNFLSYVVPFYRDLPKLTYTNNMKVKPDIYIGISGTDKRRVYYRKGGWVWRRMLKLHYTLVQKIFYKTIDNVKRSRTENKKKEYS